MAARDKIERNRIQGLPPWEFLKKALPGSKLSDFEFSLPLLTKSTDEIGRRYIRGVASTPEKDLQDEYVVQKGLELEYFLKNGYFNDDHKPGFENKVGQPTVAVVKRIRDASGTIGLNLYVEGYLWPEKSHRGADSIWELGKALEIAKSDRRLGFSIQGKVLQRNGDRILRAWLQDVAITPSPVNVGTWLELVEHLTKSWASTEEIEQVYKSISADSIPADIGEPQEADVEEQKALSASGGLALVPESLEGTRKQTFGKDSFSQNVKDRKTITDVQKSVRFAFGQLLQRGYKPTLAHRMAVAAVARTLLRPE